MGIHPCTKKFYYLQIIEVKKENTRRKIFRPEHRLERPQYLPKDHRHPPRFIQINAVRLFEKEFT